MIVPVRTKVSCARGNDQSKNRHLSGTRRENAYLSGIMACLSETVAHPR